MRSAGTPEAELSQRVLWVLVLGILNAYDAPSDRVRPVPQPRYLPSGAVQPSTWSKNYSREIRATGEASIVDFPGRNRRPEPDWTMVLNLPPAAVDIWRFRRLYVASRRAWRRLGTVGEHDLSASIMEVFDVFEAIQLLGDASGDHDDRDPEPYDFLTLRNRHVALAIETDWRDTVTSPLAVIYRRWVQLHLLAYGEPERTVAELLERVHPATGRTLGGMTELDLWPLVMQAALSSATSVEEREAREADVKLAARRIADLDHGHASFDDWWRDLGAGPPSSWGVPGFDSDELAARRTGILGRTLSSGIAVSVGADAVRLPAVHSAPVNRGRRPGVARILAAGVGLVGIAGLAALVAVRTPEPPPEEPPEATVPVPTTALPSTLAPAPSTSAGPSTTTTSIPPIDILRTIVVGKRPRALEADDRWVWAPLTREGAIARIDPSTHESETFPVGADPTRPLVVGDAIWVPAREDGVVTVLERATGRRLAQIEIGGRPDTPLIAAGLAWVTARDDSELVAIDVATFEEVDRFPLPDTPLTPILHQGGLWVASRDGGTLTRFDPFSFTDDVPPPIPIGRRPHPPMVANDLIWISDREDGTLTVVDPLLREVATTIPAGGRLSPPVVAAGRIWVSDATSGNVVGVDLAAWDDRVVIRLDEPVSDPVAHDGFLWASAASASRVYRIDPVGGGVTPFAVDGAPGVPLSAHGILWIPDMKGRLITLVTSG